MTIELAEKDIRDGFAEVRFRTPVSRIIAGAHRRRTRKRIVFGALPALGLVAAGGTALLRVDKVWGGNVACFDSADPKKMPFGAHSPQTTGESPEELCAKEWKAGYLPSEILDRSSAPFPVPPLTACVIDDVSIGVFPTDQKDFCSAGPVAKKMELADIPDGYTDHIEHYIAMRADATERVRDAAIAAGGSEDNACLDEAGARSLVEDVLVDHGHDDWTIRVSHSKRDAPCWMHINFDNTSSEVVIYSTRHGLDEIWINDAGAFRKS